VAVQEQLHCLGASAPDAPGGRRAPAGGRDRLVSATIRVTRAPAGCSPSGAGGEVAVRAGSAA
jgi:hypothetical protein